MEIQSVRGGIPEACGDRSRVALTSHPGTRSENAICIQGLGFSVFRVVLFWGGWHLYGSRASRFRFMQ